MQLSLLPTDFADDQPLQVAFSSEQYYGSVILDFQTGGEWAFYYDFEGIRFDIDSGTTSDLKNDPSNLLQLVVNQQEIALYLNSQPLTYLKNIQMQGDLNWTVLNTITARGGELSEIQIWDLSALDGETASEEEGEPTTDPLIATQQARTTATAQAQLQKLLFKRKVAEGAITSLAWSPSGDRFAVASEDNQGVRMLDGETGEILSQWEDSSTDIMAWSHGGWGRYSEEVLTWSSVGSSIAAGNDQGKILLLNPQTGDIQAEIDTELGDITSLDWSSDGSKLAAGDDKAYLSMWDTTSLPPRLMVEKSREDNEVHALDQITSLTFDPEGNRILVIGENPSQVWTNSFWFHWRIPFWDTYLTSSTNSELYLSNPCWSPDGEVFVLGFQELTDTSGYGSSVSLYTSEITTSLGSGTGHSGKIFAVAWSPDGEKIASAGIDQTIRIWTGFTFQGGNQFDFSARFTVEQPVLKLAWSPDSEILLAGDTEGNIWAWDVSD
jgi:WD40 repeat protein